MFSLEYFISNLVGLDYTVELIDFLYEKYENKSVITKNSFILNLLEKKYSNENIDIITGLSIIPTQEGIFIKSFCDHFSEKLHEYIREFNDSYLKTKTSKFIIEK